MGLTRLSIRRPLTMLMIILGLVVMGFRSLIELQVDRYPSIDIPYVMVVDVFPGASPDDMESLVVEPIEDAVAGVGGAARVYSRAQENVGLVVVEFNEGTNGDTAAVDVERQLNAIRGTLPDDAGEPIVAKVDIGAVPIMEIVLSGPQGQDDLYQIADNELKDQLSSVKGVSSVTILGGRDRQIAVQLDPDKLVAYGVPMSTIQQMLVYDNMTFPAGSVDEGNQKTSVRSFGEYTDLEQIEDTVIAGGPSPIALPASLMPDIPTGMDTGGFVYLKNVASVSEGYADTERLLRHNGDNAVSISVVKTSDANTLEVADAIQARVDEINAGLPDGAELQIVVDDSRYTRMAVNAVLEDLILAILITGLVMLIFLHTIRSTAIVVLAIPTSIMSTFIVMAALGFSLNTLTLLALTLTVGILVDDSIVVLENVERHLKMGKSRQQAALDGRAEIGLAAITITLVDVVVYVPVAFATGLVGQFFRSYGVTIAACTLFSLFVSFTLTPLLASRWMQEEVPGESQVASKPRGLKRVLHTLWMPFDMGLKWFGRLWDRGFDAVMNLYGRLLGWSLKNRGSQLAVVGLAIVSLVAGVYLVVGGLVGTEFLPQEDDGRFSVNIEMPGGTNLETTDRAARQAEQVILDQVPEVVTMLTKVGTSGTTTGFDIGATSNSATIVARVVDKEYRDRSTTDIIEGLRPELAQIPDAEVSLVLSSMISNVSGATVQLQVYGTDPDQLIEYANQVEAVMETVPGTVDVMNLDAARSPEARIVIQRDRAADLGLTSAQLASGLRTALAGTTVGSYGGVGVGDQEIDVILQMNEETRDDLGRLLEIPLIYQNGQPVKLSQVATLERDYAPAVIRRSDRQRQLTVSCEVQGRASGDVTNDIVNAVNEQVDFQPGYGIRLFGVVHQQEEAFSTLYAAMALSVVLIYMLLVALFQSWLHPLVIMFSLPVTLVGAFGGLLIAGYTLNIVSLLGIILLMGIVTKNAILLVDFTNTLREEHGYARKDALVEAGRLRLRPILMTTFALVFSLSPLLLGQGAGSEMRAPMAAVVIGGSLSSMLLTLILIPVIYNIFDAGSDKLRRVWRMTMGDHRALTTTGVPESPMAVSATPGGSGNVSQ